MALNVYTSPRRLYLTADGKVVGHDSPDKQTLLVAEGGTLPLADAERYGLVTVEQTITPVENAVEEKAVKAAPANKAVKAAPADKSK